MQTEMVSWPGATARSPLHAYDIAIFHCRKTKEKKEKERAKRTTYGHARKFV